MYYRFLFILLLCLASTSQLSATHIVGGEMNYTCLGDNQYEITLVIFRDCYNGNPQAWFDDPASIGVFHGQTNQLINEILIPWDPILNDTLEPVLSSECFVAPPDVCVHTTTYTTIVTLPPQIGGYTLAYQRCCRNETITNIVNPLATGATFSVFISETALLECNSNPKFNTWPPLYICVNEPISFDQSAFDIDGDSIVYKLCTPLNGASPMDPMPQPPFNPPYPPITWIDPPYNDLNMLNGSPGSDPLTIDPHTGLLTGLPNTIGQFVVGICVEEYRNGELISTTRRDFQYNVGECGQTLSSFSAPEIQCGDLSVSFENLSQNADEYLWYFNDPGNPGATSSSTNPVFTFSDTGTYTIMLIAEPGTVCVDTSYQTITLLPNSLIPFFTFEIANCSDSLVLELTDLSVDTIHTITAWNWTVPGAPPSQEQNPIFVLYQNTNALVTLTVTASNGCEAQIAQWIPLFLIEEEIADTLKVCLGDSIPLNPEFDSLLAYIWEPGSTLSNPLSPNPYASPDSTTTYTVTIINFTGCSAQQEVTVVVPEPLTLLLPPDTVTCEPVLTLTAQTNAGVEFYWATDPDINELIGLTASIEVEPFGPMTYYVLVRDSFGCAIQGDVSIDGRGVNLEMPPAAVACLGDTLQLSVTVTDPGDEVIFNWSPDSLILSGGDTPLPQVLLPNGGDFLIFLETSNQWGCSRLDTLSAMAVDTANLEIGFASQQCNGYAIQFTYAGVNAGIVNWDFGNPLDPGIVQAGSSPYYIYPDTGWYTVTISLPGYVECPDTAFFDIYVGNPGIDLAFDWNYPICGDSILIQFNNLSENNQGTFVSQQWSFSNGASSADPAPALVFFENTSLDVQLIMASSDGCVDTLAQTLEIELLNPALTDTVVVCFGEPAAINPGFEPDWTYQWSPPDGLNDPSSPNPMANPDQTTTYSVTITDTGGVDTCSVVRSVTVVIPPPFDWQATSDTIICEPALTLQAFSNAATSIEWSAMPNFSIILGTGNELVAEPGRPSTYYVRAADAYGCTLLDTITAGNYEVSIAAPPQTTLCIGDTVALNALNLYPDDILTFVWSPAAEIITGQGTGTVTVSPPVTTPFTYVAGNQYGCLDTGQVVVNIFNYIPPLDVLAQEDTIVAGQSSQLLALSGPDNPVPGMNYSWTPAGTLSAAGIYNPIATPLETTQYEVTIVTPDGCSNRGLVLVVVVEPICEGPYIFVPTGFSPNGDGKNEVFRVRGNFIDEIYLAVYDRWGERVFETTDPAQGWDGTYKGETLPPDVYGFYVRVLCLGGDEFIRKGNITLIR
jgi:gliding motility-associated-like protein